VLSGNRHIFFNGNSQKFRPRTAITMAPTKFKGTQAEQDLMELYQNSTIDLTTKMAEVYPMRDSFKELPKKSFANCFYRFMKFKREGTESARNGGQPPPSSKFTASTSLIFLYTCFRF